MWLQLLGLPHWPLSQSLKFTVQLLQIPEKVVISQIMQQIAELDPDMILLYTSTEIMKSLVQEVKWYWFESIGKWRHSGGHSDTDLSLLENDAIVGGGGREGCQTFEQIMLELAIPQKNKLSFFLCGTFYHHHHHPVFLSSHFRVALCS